MINLKKKKRTSSYASIAEQRKMLGTNLNFAASEAYKLLRANLLFSLPDNDDKCKIFGITSSMPSEGKSTTAVNLALSIAEARKRVLLIEGDMRLPVMSKRLEIRRAPGLSNLLAGLCTDKEAVCESGLSNNLFVIVGGDIPPNPSELLGSDRMAKLVEALAPGFDYIIFDLPPLTSVSDGLVLSKLLDGMIVVVRRDYCDQQSLAETVRQLEFQKIKILGFVLTRSETGKKVYKKYKKSGYNYGYNYGYGYGYGKNVPDKKFSSAESLNGSKKSQDND